MTRMPLSAAVIMVGALSCGAPSTRGETVAGYLRSQPRPVFRAGHTLLPLTRWGWSLSIEAGVELAEHWGYALEFGEANSRAVAALAEPDSRASRLCALAASDPERYPLSVLVYRACLSKSFREELPPAAWCQDAAGNLVEGKRIWSPLAPPAVFEQAAAEAVGPLREIRARAPLAMVLNGGEYALSVCGHHRRYWEQDPKVVAARGQTPWYDYISERKAAQETIISDAIRRACPDRRLYIFYFTAGCSHRKRYGGWDRWAWDYADLQPISDVPNSSIYYRHFNSGWEGNSDMLTHTLNTVGRNIALGQTLSYNWVNGGWRREAQGEAAFSAIDIYIGYLKCYYTAGMIGGVAGYFSYPEGGFAAPVGDTPPHWLEQMTALARVHALFSHFEDIIRHGDLVAGPQRHRWSDDQPAYELPVSRPGTRVVARKHRERSEYLVTVWQPSGAAGAVSVDVPGIGELELVSRRGGSVYLVQAVDRTPRVRLIDADPMRPSASFVDRH